MRLHPAIDCVWKTVAAVLIAAQHDPMGQQLLFGYLGLLLVCGALLLSAFLDGIEVVLTDGPEAL